MTRAKEKQIRAAKPGEKSKYVSLSNALYNLAEGPSLTEGELNEAISEIYGIDRYLRDHTRTAVKHVIDDLIRHKYPEQARRELRERRRKT